MFFKKQVKIKQKNKQQAGFTLIEILVVVCITALTAIGLTLTAKSMVLANLQLRFINNIQQNTQNFSQAFIKMARMSGTNGTTIDDRAWGALPADDISKLNKGALPANTQTLFLLWRQQQKEDLGTSIQESLNYKNVLVKIDQTSIETFFPDMKIDKVNFQGGGFDDINRITLNMEVTAGPNVASSPNDPLNVTIPIQITVALRDF